MATHAVALGKRTGFSAINTRWHERALQAFGLIIALHWVEHVAQAWQIWVMDRPRPEARGFLGAQWPWLVSSEWLHYGYAIVMLIALALLLPGFKGRSRAFWMLAFVIQIWHFIEHQILLVQVQTHHNWGGAKAPQSVLQHFWFTGSRPELHLFYNTLVTIPMLVAIYFHMYPPKRERAKALADCTCARAA
jgi:hypothetical protein